MDKPDIEAVLKYGDGQFTVVRPGNFVRCVVTGERIPVENLRYWSVERQEAYADAEQALVRERECAG